ncbi:hypothetical protein [Phenylobacterium deserti]|uniref:hypothetical protein n=1 Tax=Phenylobacterium deserti TaxID=1914756 RepID=UPI001057A26D|nr:hypothetical protein [Phenylobacterium deserti]
MRIEVDGATPRRRASLGAKVGLALLAAVVVIVGAALFFNSPRSGPEDKAKDAATNAVEAVVDGMDTRADVVRK